MKLSWRFICVFHLYTYFWWLSNSVNLVDKRRK